MSERYAIALDFDVMFSQERARRLFRVMASAVSENWSQARDQFAHPHPDLPVEPNRWAELCVSRYMLHDHLWDASKRLPSRWKEVPSRGSGL